MTFQFSIPTSATSGGLSYNDIMYAEMSVIVVDVSPALETPLKNANELDLSFPNVFDLLFCLVLFSFIDSFSFRSLLKLTETHDLSRSPNLRPTQLLTTT